MVGAGFGDGGAAASDGGAAADGGPVVVSWSSNSKRFIITGGASTCVSRQTWAYAVSTPGRCQLPRLLPRSVCGWMLDWPIEWANPKSGNSNDDHYEPMTVNRSLSSRKHWFLIKMSKCVVLVSPIFKGKLKVKMLARSEPSSEWKRAVLWLKNIHISMF